MCIRDRYYGKEGQTSIDPVVFFKLMLIGYLENIPSDRKIVEQAGMRLDMLYFLNYNIDEPLPWHSTLSRTRKLYGEELFLKVFNHILELCIKTGMVDGRTQAIDSTLIKANASMASLSVNLKIAGQEYYNKLKNNSEEDNTKYPPKYGLVGSEMCIRDSRTSAKFVLPGTNKCGYGIPYHMRGIGSICQYTGQSMSAIYFKPGSRELVPA